MQEQQSWGEPQKFWLRKESKAETEGDHPSLNEPDHTRRGNQRAGKGRSSGPQKQRDVTTTYRQGLMKQQEPTVWASLDLCIFYS